MSEVEQMQAGLDSDSATAVLFGTPLKAWIALLLIVGLILSAFLLRGFWRPNVMKVSGPRRRHEAVL